MAYLKLDESNQIVAATAEDAVVELMEGQWTVAWVEGSEIKMWGSMDEGGFIDSTRAQHAEISLGESNEMDEDATAAAIVTVTNHLKGLGKKVYKDAVEQ